jgi:hypothetical protein
METTPAAKTKHQGIKLVIALVLLAAAGGVLAWSQGWMSSAPAPVRTEEPKPGSFFKRIKDPGALPKAPPSK